MKISKGFLTAALAFILFTGIDLSFDTSEVSAAPTSPFSVEGPFYIRSTGAELNKPWYNSSVNKIQGDVCRKKYGTMKAKQKYVMSYKIQRYYVRLWSQKSKTIDITCKPYG